MMTGDKDRDDAPFVMTAAERIHFGDFLYKMTGMIFGKAKRYYIDRRITDRMAATGNQHFPDYFAHLRGSRQETEHLINSFTVNETYFYREEHQLLAMGRNMLPAIIAGRRPGDLVRIWSMPCSTGEEAYSIAIWLLENWPLVDAYNIEIVGSDIDTAALAAAAAGAFGERALARLPADVVERYFEPKQPDGTRKIIDDLLESVKLTATNLIDPQSMRARGRFDIIFCRNVLIYFDDDSRRIAANNIFDSLNPGGFACLGHTESMTRIDGRFEVARFADAIVYRKP